MDGSQKYYDEQETDTKGYTRCDPIYIKWKKNQWIHADRNQKVVVSWVESLSGRRHKGTFWCDGKIPYLVLSGDYKDICKSKLIKPNP